MVATLQMPGLAYLGPPIAYAGRWPSMASDLGKARKIENLLLNLMIQLKPYLN